MKNVWKITLYIDEKHPLMIIRCLQHPIQQEHNLNKVSVLCLSTGEMEVAVFK